MSIVMSKEHQTHKIAIKCLAGWHNTDRCEYAQIDRLDYALQGQKLSMFRTFTQYQCEVRTTQKMLDAIEAKVACEHDLRYGKDMKLLSERHVLFTFAHGLQGEKQSICLVKVISKWAWT
eukprot:314151_1